MVLTLTFFFLSLSLSHAFFLPPPLSLFLSLIWSFPFRASFYSSVPELVERKRMVDQHTTLASAMLDQIKSRQLDMFFDLEEHLLCGKKPGDEHLDKYPFCLDPDALSFFVAERSVLDVLRDPSAGTAEDKLRLFVMDYMKRSASDSASDADSSAGFERSDEIDACLTALTEAGADTSLMPFLRRYCNTGQFCTDEHIRARRSHFITLPTLVYPHTQFILPNSLIGLTHALNDAVFFFLSSTHQLASCRPCTHSF